MPAARTLALCPEQRTTLECARDHHPRPYVRERAAAIIGAASKRQHMSDLLVESLFEDPGETRSL